MLAELLRKWPRLHGTLVDVPRTVALSGEIFHAADVASRVTVIGQSFFDALPSGADVYLLKKVLDNWPDRQATAILSRCAEAARRTVASLSWVPRSRTVNRYPCRLTCCWWAASIAPWANFGSSHPGRS